VDQGNDQLSELDRKVARLASLLAGDEPASDELLSVEGELRRRLRSYEPRVDTEAVAQEAVVRLLERLRSGSEEEVRHPGGLLLVIAQRLALDQLRSAWVTRTEPMPVEELERQADDDAIAALLSREASAQRVEQALKAAADAGDHLVVRCVTAWLDLAERHGAAPSSREVAAAASVSHTSVANALARFRAYLTD
jgi:DNA-directed RNA polymerase specialized sigma24 family protein